MESSNHSLAKTLGLVFLVLLLVLLVFRMAKQGVYSDRLGMNIVIFGKDGAGLLMLRPEEEVVGWIRFPSNLILKIFNSEARYPIVSLWQYGNTERNPYEIAEKTIGLSMGVTIARTIKTEGETSVEGILASLHRWNLKTDLSLRDRILIRKLLVEAVASRKVLEMDIPNKIFDQTEEPDGKKTLSFNSVTSLWTKNKFVLESILGENVELTVNNLSGQLGLGTQVARQLESAGMRVIEVKSDLTEEVPGKGCYFRIVGNYPFTELLLTQQMNCIKFGKSEPESEKGITVLVK